MNNAKEVVAGSRSYLPQLPFGIAKITINLLKKRGNK